MAPRLELCTSFHHAVELIGRRWSGAIIFLLLKDSARFAELRAGITGITDRMLSERLHELEAEGIVVRTVIPETPVRVEYALSEKGRGLAKVMDAITAWAHEWPAAGDLADVDATVATACADDANDHVGASTDAQAGRQRTEAASTAHG